MKDFCISRDLLFFPFPLGRKSFKAPSPHRPWLSPHFFFPGRIISQTIWPSCGLSRSSTGCRRFPLYKINSDRGVFSFFFWRGAALSSPPAWEEKKILSVGGGGEHLPKEKLDPSLRRWFVLSKIMTGASVDHYLSPPSPYTPSSCISFPRKSVLLGVVSLSLSVVCDFPGSDRQTSTKFQSFSPSTAGRYNFPPCRTKAIRGHFSLFESAPRLASTAWEDTIPPFDYPLCRRKRENPASIDRRFL